MMIVGYLLSVLIGVSLGLIGGGGSVLTVPVLVYIFGVDAVLATGYSLFIVGATSAVGSIQYFKSGLINLRTAIIFGIPSIAAVYLTRALIVPLIPDSLINIGGLEITKAIFLMIVFALLMIAASYSMIKKGNSETKDQGGQVFNYPLIFLEGSAVGLLTGLVGAGGGFLIIPALVVLSKLPMKEAVGTSLLIIAAKSLFGFFGELGHADLNWTLLLSVTCAAVIGIFLGSKLSKKIDGEKLKPAFGWFVLVMGLFIIVKETILK